MRALGESIGFLLISVVVSALAPAAVAYVTELFDEAAEAMFAPVVGDAASMVVAVTTGMAALMAIPGGAVIVIFLAMCMLTAVAGVWLELIVRNALILSGLVFGTSVFSGLVDKSLWNHTKRWIGVMAAVIASKYVTLTTIALATGVLSTNGHGDVSVVQAFGTVFTAIALLFLALFLPFSLTKFLPLVGDELQHMYQTRDDLKGRAQHLGNQVGDTFGELRSRFGGTSDGGGDGASEVGGGGATGSDEGGAAREQTGAGGKAAGTEGAAASTGVGAAAVAGKKAVDRTKEQAEEAAGRAVDGATAGTGGDTSAAPDAPPTGPDTGVGEAVGSGPGTVGSGSDGLAGVSSEPMPPPDAPAHDHTTGVVDGVGAPETAPPPWPPSEPVDEEPAPQPDDQPR
ncbi:hypothetical protein LUX05_04530 [Streptomyces somaliensis]|nr:hypothetical protein [Streptomyces somaliensis]